MRKIAILTLLAAVVVGLAWAAGKPAMVRLKQEGIVAEIVFEKGPKLMLTTKPVPLPEGEYKVKSIKLRKQDDKKQTWERQGDGRLSTIETVAVEAEQEKVIDVGEPILFDCFIWANGKTLGDKKAVILKVTAIGHYSEVYYPGAIVGGKRPLPPAWKLIASADGKILGQGQFVEKKFGGSVEPVTIYIPNDYHGKAKMELTPTMGPFEWKYKSQEYDFRSH